MGSGTKRFSLRDNQSEEGHVLESAKMVPGTFSEALAF